MPDFFARLQLNMPPRLPGILFQKKPAQVDRQRGGEQFEAGF
jgi:hypothetical protein